MTKPRRSKKYSKRVPSRAMWEVEFDLYEPAKTTRRNPNGYKYVAGFKCRSTGYVFRHFMKGKKAKEVVPKRGGDSSLKLRRIRSGGLGVLERAAARRAEMDEDSD